MALQVQHLPGVSIRGSGAAFPARTVTNDEILDLLIRHYYVRDNQLGWWRQARNAGARLAGEGFKRYLRAKYPTSDELIRFFGFPPGIVKKMGIGERQWAHMVGDRLEARGENGSDLALRAARAALEDAGTAVSEIDALVVTTTTPARINSSTALWLAEQLGLAAPAYDLRAGCSGSVYALLQASLYLQHGCKRVLVVGAEAYSRFLSPTSRDAIFVAGDGAGALVLERRDDPSVGVLSGLLGADGQYDRRFFTLGGMPPTAEAAAQGHYYVQGEPRDMVEASFKKYLEIIPEALALAGVGIEDIGLHVPHQAALNVIQSVARHIGHPMERTFVNLHRHGNIGSACLLAGLHEARQEGRLRPGEKLLLSVVGGTLTWGSMVWQL